MGQGCDRCWSPIEPNEENCPSCGYPDNEGNKMTLEELIYNYLNGDMDYNEVRKFRLIDLLLEERENLYKQLKELKI